MDRTHENDCFRRFCRTRDPRLLAEVFDGTAPELLRVASYLTGGDRDATQDALQQTFLTAIEDAGSFDASRDVRPWLLGILANAVRRERRRRARRREIDERSAELAGDESAVDAAAARELGAATVQAMKALPSPFREAIVLHLQHGLNAKEIADALGRPAGTVRTQLVRGLDKLRGLLPAGFAMAAVGVAMVPSSVLAAVRRDVLATLPEVAVAGSSSLALTGWRIYAMVASGVLLFVSVMMGWWQPEVAPPPVQPEVSAAAPDAARAGDDAAVRENVGLAPPPRVASAPAVAAQGRDDAVRVTLLVTYADGSPAARRVVAYRRDGEVVAHATGDDGVLVLDLPWPGHHELHALGTHSSVTLFWPSFARRPAEETHRMQLAAGMTLAVEVVDEAGAPVAGALVECSAGARVAPMLSPFGRTDEAGRFRWRDVERNGQLRVWAPGFLPGDILSIDGKPGETCERRVTLRRAAHAVRGVVRGADGAPIAGARLALVQLLARPEEPQFLRSGADGAFVLDTLHAGRHVLVGQHHDDEELLRGAVRFSTDDDGIELRLTTGGRVEGTLRDADGNPLAGVNVVARDRPEAVHALPFQETWTSTAADGTFALAPLVAGVYELESENVRSQFVTVRDGELVRQDLQRRGLQPARFQLVDAAGAPLDNWRVLIIPPGRDFPDAGTSTGPDGRPIYTPGSGWEFEAGASYRLAAAPPLPGAKDFRDGYTHLPALITPPLVVGAEHVVRVADVARQLHVIRGELVDEAGQPIRDAKVELVGALGSVFGQRLDVDEHGRFAFEHQPSGRYHASVRMPGRPTLALPAIDVRTEGDASFGRVVVPATGRVQVAVGAAAADGLTLQLVSSSGRAFRLRRGDDGRWRSGALYRGDYELRGWTATQWVAPKPVRVDRDEVSVDATLVAHESTRVVVELPFDHPRNAGSWSGTVQALRDGAVLCEHRVGRAFLGVFQDRMEFLLPLPPGSVQVRVQGWNGSAGRAQARVPADGGGAVTVRLQ